MKRSTDLLLRLASNERTEPALQQLLDRNSALVHLIIVSKLI